MAWLTNKKTRERQRQWRWQIHLENTPKMGFLKTFREHSQMAILEKSWVWPLIHCNEFSPSRPNGWGWANFTILKYLRYLEYLELGQFRNLIFAMFLTSIGPLLFYPLPFPPIPQFFLLYFPYFSFSLFSKSEDGAQWSLFPDWSSHHPPADNGVRKPTTLDKTKVRMGGRILKKERVRLVFRGLPQIKIKPSEAIRGVFNGCDEFKGFE